MGILFCKWKVGEEDFTGDKFKREEHKKEELEANIEFSFTLPPKNDDTVENLGIGDIIGLFDKERGLFREEFIVDKIEDEKIFGNYIFDFSAKGLATVEFTHKDWVKIGTTIKEKL